MKKILYVLAVLLWTVFLQSLTFAAGKKSSTESYLQELQNQGKERVIVIFKDTINETALADFDVKFIRKLKIINAIVCEVNQTDIELLKQQPNVKDVVPDMLLKIPEPRKHELPSEGIMPLSYQGPVTVRWNNLEAGVNSQAAWDNYNLDGNGAIIAFLDTGVDYTLPDLDANYLGGYDFVNEDENPMDDESHGTQVASVALGEGEVKIVGTAPGAQYYALKVLGACPSIRFQNA